MVNHRGHHLSSSRSRKSSILSVTLYVILIFALSIFTFMLYSKDVLDDEYRMPLLRVEKPKSKQVCVLVFQLGFVNGMNWKEGFVIFL